MNSFNCSIHYAIQNREAYKHTAHLYMHAITVMFPAPSEIQADRYTSH